MIFEIYNHSAFNLDLFYVIGQNVAQESSG